MKNYKLPVMGLALVLLITSCKKEDVQQNSTKTADAKGSWNTLSNWSTAKVDDSTTTHFSQVADTSITTNVAKSGLVLVFKKDGNAVQSLPFEDKSTSTFWYYQVSHGALRVNVTDNGSSQKNFSGQAFSYLIFTPEKLSALSAKGKTKFDLMQLTYEQALVLSK